MPSNLSDIIRQLEYYRAGGGRQSQGQQLSDLFKGTGTALETTAKGISSGIDLRNKLNPEPDLKGQADIEETKAKTEYYKSLIPEKKYEAELKAGTEKNKISSKKELEKSSELSQPEIKYYGTQLRTTGQMPSLGLGGTKLRALISKEAADQALALGQTPQAGSFNRMSANAYQGELSNLQKQRGTVLTFEKTALKNIDLALQRSGKISKFDSPIFNRWKLWIQGQGAGDPDVFAVDAAMKVAANEIAKVTSTATGNMIPEQEREEYRKLFGTALNMESINAVSDVVKQDMSNRESSYNDQINDIHQQILNLGNVNTQPKQLGNDKNESSGKIGIAKDSKGRKARVEFNKDGSINKVLNEIP